MNELVDPKKELSYEMMRAFACFFIVAIHSFNDYFSLVGKINIYSWIYADIVMSFSKPFVPLFVMVTGSLLLKKEMPVKRALKKSGHFFVILSVWSIVYLLVSHVYINHEKLDALQIIRMFFSSGIMFHLWYLYMLIGIYLTLPLITKLVQKAAKLVKYYIILFLSYSFVITLFAVLSKLFDLDLYLNFLIPMMDWQLGCLLIGYFLSCKAQITKKLFALSLVILSISTAASILCTFFLCTAQKQPLQDFLSNNYLMAILSAGSVYIITKYLSGFISERKPITKIFRFIGMLSLDIYLVHPLVLIFYSKVLARPIYLTFNKISIWHTIMLIVVFVLSIGIAFIINLLKLFIKRLAKPKNNIGALTTSET